MRAIESPKFVPCMALSVMVVLSGCGSSEVSAISHDPAEVPVTQTNAPVQPPVAFGPVDHVHGKDGLEGKCHAHLAKKLGVPVLGTKRIEASEVAVAVYVNVQGAQAPWCCLGHKDGSIVKIFYTGDEGSI